MKVRVSSYKVFLIVISGFFSVSAHAQFLVDMIDTTATEDKGLWAVYGKTDHLQIGGYFQPQFQISQSKGVENYSGGDFAQYSNNRFLLRRARIRFEYDHFTQSGLPQAQVVFQFDGSERGVVIRDFWGRLYENKWQLFSFTTGMFARPFGYELNLGSGDRESPERGRMSQILMKTERDLGVMVSLEPRKKSSPLRLLKVDLGIFNGQGLTATEDYDGFKDLIGRVSLKPYAVSKNILLSAGASFFQGGLVQSTKYIYSMTDANVSKTFLVDSSEANIGRKAPRKYHGFDGQVKISNPWGKTELRGEYWWGTQTGSALQSNTPAALLNQPYYIRNFNGAFFYLLQNIINTKNQVVLKYDIYDPNKFVKGADIGQRNTNKGDIKYSTFGFGYNHYFDSHIKFMIWYDMIRNENTSLNGFTDDIKDNVLTFRLQYKF